MKTLALVTLLVDGQVVQHESLHPENEGMAVGEALYSKVPHEAESNFWDVSILSVFYVTAGPGGVSHTLDRSSYSSEDLTRLFKEYADGRRAKS